MSTPPQTRPVLLPNPEPEPEPTGRHRVDNALTGALDAAAVRAALEADRLDLADLPRMPPRHARQGAGVSEGGPS